MPGKGKPTRRSGKASGRKRSARSGASSRKTSSKSSRKSSSKTSGKSKPPAKAVGAARPKRIEQMRLVLLERLESLKGGMEQALEGYHSIGAAGPKGVRGDVSDLAADSLDGDTALQLAESGSDEIAQIGEALTKIDDGSYGKCETCSGDIPWSRLEAVPYATLCIECKRRQEITGGAGADGSAGWSAVEDLADLDE